MKIALVIGHNSRAQGGYTTNLGSEFSYWQEIANKVKSKLDFVDVYERKDRGGYVREMNEVLGEIRKHHYDFILELHFNMFSEKSNGCEYLCHKRSKRGQAIGGVFMRKIASRFGVKIRKKAYDTFTTVKVVDPKTGKVVKKQQRKRVILDGPIFITNDGQRGGYGICHTKPPYVLLEPFFGSNFNEADKFKDTEMVADFFVECIKEVM